jgi:hypothetical protein
MRRLALSLAALAFFLNPGFACTGQDEPEFNYGEAEMKAAVEGTWVVTVGADQITVQVAEGHEAQPNQIQAARPGGHFIRSAHACGNRTFVASANACIDSTSMPLDVTFLSGPDSYRNAVLSGGLTVASTSFSFGYFGLRLGSLSIEAGILPDGTVALAPSPSARDGGNPVTAGVSLVRTSK